MKAKFITVKGPGSLAAEPFYVFSIAGANLAPDATKDDEYVALVDARGAETRATMTFSDLQNVKAHLEAALPAGEYTLLDFALRKNAQFSDLICAIDFGGWLC